jgi:type IV pilus assembly protein PilM
MTIFKKKTSIGLEIDEQEIRAVEIFKKNNVKTIKKGSICIPKDSVSEGIINDEELVGNFIDKLWKECDFSNKSVNLGISNKNIMVRFVEFPLIPESKLEMVIKNQAKDYIPIDLESVVFDYEIISKNEDKMEVLVVAAMKEVISSYLKALNIAKLKPSEIEVSNLAVQRIISKNALTGTAAVLNIGNCMSNILIVNSNRPKLARVLPTSVKNFTDMMNIEVCDFIEFINQKEFVCDEDAINKWIESISNDLYSSVSYYQSTGEVEPPEIVYICGTGAKFPQLAERLQEYLNVKVELINPLEQYKIQKSNLSLSNDFVEYSLCISLACREMEV